jgi:hypothetical protein
VQGLPNKQIIYMEILDAVCAVRGFETIKRMLKHVCKVMCMNHASCTLSVCCCERNERRWGRVDDSEAGG